MANNYRQRMAILAKNKEKLEILIGKKFEYCLYNSGIYVLTREQDGFKFAYIGQSRQPMIDRLAEHLMGHQQHIDISLKKHKLYSEENPTGWKVEYLEPCSFESLDRMEQFWIKHYADLGFQLRNKTSGGQSGKVGIAENKPRKNYSDGLKEGYAKCLKEIQKLDKQRRETKKDGTATLRASKALEELNKILRGDYNG